MDQLIRNKKSQKRQIKKVDCKYFFNYFSLQFCHVQTVTRFFGVIFPIGINLGENVGEFLGENKHKKNVGKFITTLFKFIGENVGEITTILPKIFLLPVWI